MNIKAKYYAALLLTVSVLLAGACKKEGDYHLTELPPLDFKSYYDGLNVTFANQTQGATDITWDFGDGSTVVPGDSVEHLYSKIGNYLITMNATYQGKKYAFHTVLKVDKPSVIRLDDNSFTDWDGVAYPDFQLQGKDKILGGKIDYDANNVYFYIEWSTDGTNGLATLDEAIMDLYVDTDNSTTTGYSSSIGAELLYEGNIAASWFDFYEFSGTDQSQWNWNYKEIPDAITMGYATTEGDTVKMEFAVSREKFKLLKDAFGFMLVMNYSDWSGEFGSLTRDNETTIQVKMDKQ